MVDLAAELETLCTASNSCWKNNEASHLDCHILQYEKGPELEALAGERALCVMAATITGFLAADEGILARVRLSEVSWLLRFDPNRPALAHFHQRRPKILEALCEALTHAGSGAGAQLLREHDHGLGFYATHVTFEADHPLQPSARLERLVVGLSSGQVPKAWPSEVDL